MANPVNLAVILSSQERNDLCDCLDMNSGHQTSTSVMEDLERTLSQYYKLMVDSNEALLPSEVRDHLEPIVYHMKALRDCFDAVTLPPAVIDELKYFPLDNGNIWSELARITANAEVLLHRLRLQEHRGSHVSRFAHTLDYVESGLLEVFAELRRHERDETFDADQKQFLEICKRRLPRAPTARKKFLKESSTSKSS